MDDPGAKIENKRFMGYIKKRK